MMEINHEQDVDEEKGVPGLNGSPRYGAERQPSSESCSASSSDSVPSSRRHSSHSSSSHNSRQFSNVSTTSASDSECLDNVSEMTPLMRGNAELAPPPPSYGVVDAQRHPLRRIPSEESVKTVQALPGMVIRCHSINGNTGGRDVGSCTIRPSTTKVVSIIIFFISVLHCTSL